MSERLPARTCKQRLALLWVAAGGLLFIVLILQSLFGRYGERAEEAWAWFLPTIVPTLSLIIGGIVLEAKAEPGSEKTVDAFLFRLAFWLSAFYLLAVALTFFIQPFTGTPLLTLMARSNLWLAPLQGLAAAALGAFFVKGGEDKGGKG